MAQEAIRGIPSNEIYATTFMVRRARGLEIKLSEHIAKLNADKISQEKLEFLVREHNVNPVGRIPR